ncbi:hypothetical protein M8494_20550 [Serratia ureilytica]
MPLDAAAREQLPERLRQSAQAFRIPIVALTESDAQMQVGCRPCRLKASVVAGRPAA